ncbi:MAG: ABC transporter ATP-binding protein/permease [Verrucomicrobia bacterium]|nr:ABC transporter ATP-binding protein/permease [Verrucomicrobiota bacterium]MBU1909070.1 ABC transporter ATP-binding protein/permease [Verrucomicrobiota bacterium]
MSAPESEIPARLFDRRLLGRLLRYAAPFRRYLLLAVVLIAPMALLTNLLPLLLRAAVDGSMLADLPAAERFRSLAGTAARYVGIAALAFGLRYAHTLLLSWIGQRILFNLRGDIFAKILRLPLRYFDRHPVGRLMTRVSSDVEAMQRLLTDGLVGLIGDLFMLVGLLGFIFYLNARLASRLLILLPVLFVVVALINRRIRQAQRQVRQRQSALNSHLQEMLTGMLTIQLFNREAHVQKRFDHFNAGLRDAFVLAIRWFSYFFPAIEVLNALSLTIVLAVGGHALMRGEPDITLGVLVAFVAYIREFFRPLEDLSDKSNILQSAMASSERVFGLLDEPEERPDPPRPAEWPAFRGAVEFDHVWFAYEGEDWVLQDLSFRIRPGESVAVVGATGAGKTSLISLLARFYEVTRGAVRVDGLDVRAVRRAELHRRIGLVPQDPFIFSGTLASNISLEDPEMGRDRVVEAAKFVNAHGFIEARPGRYDGPVLERGATLSTGQKQLLALARALAQNPDILLILDEATASVDTETERLIQDALQRLMKGRTSIVIAHRLSTIRHVDRILVLRQGHLIEEGTHAELIRAGGYYRRLYDLLSHTSNG